MNNDIKASKSFKLRDNVFDKQYGYGTIIRISTNDKYPISVKFHNLNIIRTYTLTGQWLIGSAITLFKVENVNNDYFF